MSVLRLKVVKVLHLRRNRTIIVVLLAHHIVHHREVHVLHRQQEVALHYAVSKCQHNVRQLRHRIAIVQVVLLLVQKVIHLHREAVVQVAVNHVVQVHRVEAALVHHILQENNLKV